MTRRAGKACWSCFADDPIPPSHADGEEVLRSSRRVRDIVVGMPLQERRRSSLFSHSCFSPSTSSRSGSPLLVLCGPARQMPERMSSSANLQSATMPT